MSRVLVTGFEPFLGDRINPSQLLLRELDADPRWASLVRTRVLPVSFARAPRIVLEDIRESGFVLMLGLAKGREKICLERVALNWQESTAADEDGVRPVTGPILGAERQAYFSELPLGDWAAKLSAAGIPCQVSFSAGGYVCNHVSFRVARELEARRIPSLFVHVPCVPEMGVAQPSLPLLEMKRGLDLLLEEILLSAGPGAR